MIDDATLLRRYAEEKSGDAFAELVRRHLPVVYSAALRRLGGDTHHAEDVAQAVFCTLARHASRLARHPTLVGWLYATARHEVLNLVRAEKRRRAREEEAHAMLETDAETTADWSQLQPVLDSAMDRLGDRDREAVLLRFFQGRPFAEIGALLGLSEDAARKRVDRALDRLRDALRPRGIASTSAALAALIAHQASAAAPTALATHITGAALATGTTAGAGLFTVLAMTKTQVAVLAGIVVAGGAGFVAQQRTLATVRADHAAAREEIARLDEAHAALARRHAAAAAEVAALRQPPAASPAPALAAPAPSAAASAVVPGSVHAARREKQARLHRRYDPFLQKFGLTPAQADRFVELKLAIYDAQDDLQAAVRDAGAQGGTAGVEELRAQLVKPLWNEIRQLLGPAGYAAYADYERTSAVHLSYIEPMTPAFAAANAPLTSPQAESLARIIIANNRPFRAQSADISMRSHIDWAAVTEQATSVLSSAQLSVLQAQVSRRAANP